MTGLRVLVTGATTPIGLDLMQRLLDAGAEHVLGVGRESPEQAGVPGDPRLTYVKIDLRRQRELHDLLFGPAKRLGITAVIHAVHHRDPFGAGRSVHRLNVEATRALLQHCDRHTTIRRIVFRSDIGVYRVDSLYPDIIDEDQPIELRPGAPQWIRDRVEADVTVCARMGLSRCSIAVLRCAECLAARCGSQLHDFLTSAVCLRPLGFDPVLNVLTIADMNEALIAAVTRDVEGVFNIPGADTFTLSRAIREAGRVELPLPGPVLAPLYRARASLLGTGFRYDLNRARFHFNGILDGGRAKRELGYEPRHRVDWTALRERVTVERQLLRATRLGQRLLTSR